MANLLSLYAIKGLEMDNTKNCMNEGKPYEAPKKNVSKPTMHQLNS